MIFQRVWQSLSWGAHFLDNSSRPFLSHIFSGGQVSVFKTPNCAVSLIQLYFDSPSIQFWHMGGCQILFDGESHCTVSHVPVARTHSQIMHANLSSSKESVVFFRTLRKLLSFGNVSACWEAFSMQTHSSHQACRSLGNSFLFHNRPRCHKFVNWLCNLNFFDPVHCDLRICWFRTYFILTLSSKFHRVKNFPQIQVRKRNSLALILFFISLSIFLEVSVISSLNSCEEDAMFFDVLRIVEDSPSWAGDRSKTFPVVLALFFGNPES